MADTVYPNLDDLITARPTREQLNPTTGVLESVAITGWTDLEAFYSLTNARTATPIDPSLRVVLSEASATGAYSGVIQGSAKSTALENTPDKTKLYLHVKRQDDYHSVQLARWSATPLPL